MSHIKDAATVLDTPRGTSNEARLAIEVCDVGDYDTPQLRFTVDGFNFDHQQYVYNIRHVLYLHVTSNEKSTAKPRIELFSKSGEVQLTFGSRRTITDDDMVGFAKLIAGALGFPGGHVDVTIARRS